jgi:FkbM family methyltransferase
MRLIIDIGCNVLEGFNKLKNIENISDSDYKIFVEANPECWEFLEQATAHIPNSTLIKKALYTDERELELITRADKRADTAATVLGREFIDASLNRWNIKVNDFNTYNITTVSISTLLKLHDIKFDSIILKLDAEGVEYDVLNQILNEHIPLNKIYCEFHVHSQEDGIKRQELLSSFSNRNIQVFNWD